MSKRHFIALADALRLRRPIASQCTETEKAIRLGQWIADISAVADVCARINPRFNRDRWLNYVDGKCGPNGGAL